MGLARPYSRYPLSGREGSTRTVQSLDTGEEPAAMRVALMAKRALVALLGVVVLGGVQASASAATAPPSFDLTISPTSQTVQQRSAGQYTISLTSKSGFKGSIDLDVTGLPVQTLYQFETSPVYVGKGKTAQATLTLQPGYATPPGSKTFRVIAKSGSIRNTAQATIVVTIVNPPVPVGISDNLERIPVGGVTPINVKLTNPNNETIYVDSLHVEVTGIDQEHVTLGCLIEDYRVTQFGGQLPLEIPRKTSRTLKQLNIPQRRWSTVEMVDSPTRDQTGCLGATVTLTYTASAFVRRG